MLTKVPINDSGNDSCETAVVITEAVFARTGSFANATPTTELQTCNTTAQNLHGVWYSFANSKRRIVRIQYLLKLPPTTNISNLFDDTQEDAVLAMVKGSCSQCPERYRGSIAYNTTNYDFFWLTGMISVDFDSDYVDYEGIRVYGSEFLDGSEATFNEKTSVLIIDEFLLEPDEQYLFYVGAVDIESGGSFDFNMTEYMAPSNEECDSSIEVDTLPADYEGSLFGATSSFDLGYESDCNTTGPGVWYRIEGNGSIVNIDLRIEKTNRNTDNLQFSILGESCDLLICHGSFPLDWNYDNEEVSSHYEYFMGIGDIYFLHFSTSSFYDAVKFNLTISQDEAPANDKCSGANIISFVDNSVQTINGSTRGATPDVNLCEAKSDSKGVWYFFQGEGKLISIDLASSGWVSLFQGLCSELVCVQEGELFAESGIEYRILVEDYFASDFELTVKQFEPPENDDCDHALTIESLPFSYTGNMKGARARKSCEVGEVNNMCFYFTGTWFTFIGTGIPVQVDLTDFENLGYMAYAFEVYPDGCPSIVSDIDYNHTFFYYDALSQGISTEMGLSYHLYVAIQDNGYDKIPYYINIKV